MFNKGFAATQLFWMQGQNQNGAFTFSFSSHLAVASQDSSSGECSIDDDCNVNSDNMTGHGIHASSKCQILI
jgi:hypothetical protein